MAPPLLIGAEALYPVGSNLEISLGRAEEGAIPTVTRLIGAPPSDVADHAECAGTPVRTYAWPGGLELAFRDGDLAGWRATGVGYTTRTGVAIGGPAPADAGAAGGVAVAARDGRVSELWVGPRCTGGQVSG